jgi:hypothetical protein
MWSGNGLRKMRNLTFSILGDAQDVQNPLQLSVTKESDLESALALSIAETNFGAQPFT